MSNVYFVFYFSTHVHLQNGNILLILKTRRLSADLINVIKNALTWLSFYPNIYYFVTFLEGKTILTLRRNISSGGSRIFQMGGRCFVTNGGAH